MVEFQVGDRVRTKSSHYPDAAVTELTKRGFRWRLDEPYSLGPRHGWFQEGEAFTDSESHGWHVVSPMSGTTCTIEPHNADELQKDAE